ncbi:putative mucin-associated surface protein (MASP) [Trypanosoma theileri]|uniref:Putative mucin-associated surface protein (MASP) n=1 Tax=Trypanosoma theileri TaxID=67003 RepID=A0A1X0NKV9_9TRYP|nr:putative mucin-associated surface protein (MASP) [Trypanosoma theileri]ORC84799.1 putative mucin-associated surface protein (MASP) [Trypanosoma theileri]
MTLQERQYTLPAMGELRLVASTAVHVPTVVTLQPLAEDGGEQPRADVFGTELSPGVAVRLPAGRFCGVFSPTGCTLIVSAPSSVHQSCYGTTCGATWARSIADINTHLEVQRVKARRSGVEGLGPRALFVSDRRVAGTSTYIRMLTNYAVRLGYHPLLLDAAVDAPRFGYPGHVSLYAVQHTVDIEEEMCFVPSLHAHQGVGKHEDPSLFMHVMRGLMQLATERMARSDRCRVGGIFLDYGIIPRTLVEEAETWECSEARLEERSRTNPLDVLVDTIIEADIDHVFVVGSAWLRFKVAQRLQQRLGAPPAVSWTTPSTVFCNGGLKVQLALVDALQCGAVAEDAFFKRQCWLHYFFGTRTSAVKPTLLTLELSLVRLVQIGRGDSHFMSTFMPMEDDSEDQSSPKTQRGISLTYLHPQDFDLTDRILAISSATEQEELHDGTLQRIPFAVFESRLRRGLVMGFALVESISPTKMTILTNAAGIRKEKGLCFILTEERLPTQPSTDRTGALI